MFKIGVIGHGFVGGAVANGFREYDPKVYDKYKSGSDLVTIDRVCIQDFVFICVPTQTRRDGTQDLSSLYEVMRLLDAHNHDELVVIIKSTIVPGTCRVLKELFPKLQIIFNPEFLTARNAAHDFAHPVRIVLGAGEDGSQAQEKVRRLYAHRFPDVNIYLCQWEEAELLKYMCNCFLALKVSYLNEIYRMCQQLQIDYNFMKDMFSADPRIGPSHCDVPGFDGDFGFGGTCFPKDLKALIRWAYDQRLSRKTLEAAENVNVEIRTKKDWKWADE